MKLAEYLETENVTASHLAAQLGVSVSTVTRLANGKREPGIVLMRKIARATRGLVTPNDFLAPVAASPLSQQSIGGNAA